MSTQQPGWLPDPTGRHEQRYWDGTRWTEHVSDHGSTSVDPLEPRPVAGTPAGHPGPGGMPPGGYGSGPGPGMSPGFGYGGPGGGPPRRSNKTVLLVAVVIVLLGAGVAGAVVLIGGGEDDEKKREYVAALADAIPEGEDGMPVSDGEAECLAEAEVDIIGLDTISEVVTPAEIRENPDDGLNEWGIEPSRQQALDLLDSVQSCIDDLGGFFAEVFLADFPGADFIDTEAAGDCLADGLNQEAVRAMVAEAMASDPDEDPTEDQANVMFDWMDGCIDFRTVFVQTITEGLDDDAAACIDEGLTEDLVRQSMVASLTGDEAEADIDAELEGIVDDCMDSGSS